MSLVEYNRKRDFKKTAEPKGKAGKVKRAGLQFVIQKHDASRLHYDFRLECDGVLKSWAVPKGPSFNPKDKRLAAQVEDHPIDYGEFEGIIPAGEYGGGTVMLWDHGTWEPIGDPSAGIEAGKIHFVLNGEKLKGEWALVRMHGKFGDGGKNWLLFKVADKFADASSNVVEKKTKSVKTGRSLEQIAEQRDAVWRSNRSSENQGEPVTRAKASTPASKKSTSMPTKVQPQLAVLSDHPPQGKEWLHEIKFDGYRILAFVSDGNVQLITRNGNDYTAKFPSIVKALTKLKADTAIIDGELCAVDEHSHTDFQALQALVKDGAKATLVYYVFDLLFLNEVDLRPMPLIDRKDALEKLLASSKLTTAVQYSSHVAGNGDEVVEKACHMHLEGIVSKRADSPYVPRRDATWLKSKCTQRQEFVIIGWSDPQGGRTGFGSLLIGYYEGKELMYAGRVGTGFNDKLLKSLHATLSKASLDQSPVDGPLPAREKREAHWTEPTLVCEVNFTGWTRDGVLRHPAFVALRSDKPAKDVVREKAIDPEKVSKPKAAAKSKNKAIAVAKLLPPRDDSDPADALTNATARRSSSRGAAKSANASVEAKAGNDSSAASHKIILTHPDKELFPNEHITKQQIADYYAIAAEWMLPRVANRPLALVRCPAGQTKKCFFQRNFAEGMPASIDKVNVSYGHSKGYHVTIHDADGLTGLVQIGILEIHAWQCANSDIDHPDQLIFDLDPGPDVSWKDVVNGAKKLRERLSELKLDPLIKTSGGKGLHLVLPIVSDIDWDTTKAFCGEVANEMVKRDDNFVANMRKDLRGGKIYIDYHRNGLGATAVAPYSTRARAGAPVSMPISWDEIGRLKSGAQFTVDTAPRYLQNRKTDPWRDYEQHRIDLRKLVGG